MAAREACKPRAVEPAEAGVSAPSGARAAPRWRILDCCGGLSVGMGPCSSDPLKTARPECGLQRSSSCRSLAAEDRWNPTRGRRLPRLASELRAEGRAPIGLVQTSPTVSSPSRVSRHRGLSEACEELGWCWHLVSVLSTVRTLPSHLWAGSARLVLGRKLRLPGLTRFEAWWAQCR